MTLTKLDVTAPFVDEIVSLDSGRIVAQGGRAERPPGRAA